MEYGNGTQDAAPLSRRYMRPFGQHALSAEYGNKQVAHPTVYYILVLISRNSVSFQKISRKRSDRTLLSGGGGDKTRHVILSPLCGSI